MAIALSTVAGARFALDIANAIVTELQYRNTGPTDTPPQTRAETIAKVLGILLVIPLFLLASTVLGKANATVIYTTAGVFVAPLIAIGLSGLMPSTPFFTAPVKTVRDESTLLDLIKVSDAVLFASVLLTVCGIYMGAKAGATLLVTIPAAYIALFFLDRTLRALGVTSGP